MAGSSVRAVRGRRVAPAVLAVVALGLGGLVAAAPGHAAAANSGYLADPASAVDPIIGTSGAVDDFPGADVPFGMVEWSPDTPSRPAGGGYEYNDTSVTGFSLNHISGPGCGAEGDIPVLPTTGSIGSSPSSTTLPLDHKDESATAGTYRLNSDGISTAITTTTRSGMARFQFPGKQSNLLFKLSGSADGDQSTHFQVVNDHEVSGWVTSGQFCGASDEYDVYFDMVFDSPFSSSGTWQDGSDITRGARALNVDHPTATGETPVAQRSSNGVLRTSPRLHGAAKRASAQAQTPVSGADGAYVTFDTAKHSTVQAKVGLSYVSTKNAALNRSTENPGWNFAKVSTAAHDEWNTMLSKVQIGGGTPDEQKVFETAMYHALLHPNVYSDVNGQYMGFDGQMHRTPGTHVEYANFSGWDIYRSQVQLASMVAPQQTSDSIRSMLDQYDQTGQLPKWELNNGESYVMVGDPADPIIADAYAFGARNFNTAHALAAMQMEANKPNNIRPGLTYYEDDGYLPLDGSYGCCNFYGPVSTQQEYNTADYAIASFARSLGKGDIAETFAQRANNWQNVFNPASGYLQAKNADGSFASGFTPSTSTGFVEGTSAQYTPMEPFDIAGLAAADGGNANWVKKLDSLSQNIASPGPVNADFGNEPSIEIPWEYDYVGAPYKTQSTVRSIQQTIFTPTPDGIAGNDDLGAMSSWYVFSALGFYPETPGTTDLALGSAVFPRAAIHLPSGKTLTITAPDASAAKPYISSMTVNGAGWAHAYLPGSLVSKGGHVTESLSAQPNKSWATASKDAPPSDSTGLADALGYTTGSTTVLRPGKTGSLTIGARNLTGHAQEVTWTATVPNGMSVSPASGSLSLAAHGDGTRRITLSAPPSQGRFTVTIAYRSGTGAAMPGVATQVDVAKPGALWPYYNNAGIASDGQSGAANFDGDGWAYSEQQLQSQGLGSGQTKTVHGIKYTMPKTDPGEPDNIEAGGQTIPVSAKNVSRIGFLGSATNASPGASTTVTVHFSDGSTKQVKIALSDWTLGAGGTDPVAGNHLAAKTAYRDTSDGGQQVIATYLFTADAGLGGSRTVTAVTIPASTDDGQLHVLAIGTA